MAKIYGQLERAQAEVKATDYAATIVGLIWWNSADGQFKIADGTNVRSFLRNDQKAIIGNHATPANNVRFHRGASGVLQLVGGGDVTAEGTLSTTLNQLSARQENFTTGARPTFGNAGRLIWNTTTSTFQGDTGAAWFDVSIGTNTITSANLRQSVALSVMGNSTNATANVADIVAATSGHVLRLSGTALGFGRNLLLISSKTANYTATDADEVIYVDGSAGAFAITLHTPSVNQRLTLVRTDNTRANAVSITGTVNGQTDYKLHTQYETYVLEYNTVLAAWLAIAHPCDTQWASYTPTFTGFGTAASIVFRWRRKGSTVEIHGTYNTGTPTGVEGRITLPSDMTAATEASIQPAGEFLRAAAVTAQIRVLIESAVAYMTFSNSSASGELTKATGANVAGTGESVALRATIRINGWKD